MKSRETAKIKNFTHLKQQLAIAIMLIMAGTLFLCWLLNHFLLDNFYLQHKYEDLEDTFYQMDNDCQDGTLYSKDNRADFERYCAESNVSVLIISAEGEVELTSSASPELMMSMLNEAQFLQNNDEIIESTDDYTLKMEKDQRSGSEYVVLWGTLNDGNIVLIRSAVESLRAAANIANTFLAYVAIFGVVLTILVAEVFSRKVTKPIRELTDLSKHMTELDFNAKYRPRSRQNEIDQLGIYMNDMSSTLESSIGQLKEANAKLEQDILRKDQNEQMRKEFMSNISHELKTPIALIQGYAEGLKEDVTQDKESRDFYLDVIIDESSKMNRMVKELLALNQLEFGENQVQMERVELNPVIESLISNSGILMEEKGIHLTFCEPVVYAWADEFFLEQVISNYLSNAIHYCKNEKEIRISYEMKEGSVRVNVFNSGDPIPEESIPHLWEKFYKVDKARTREYGGTGIGLSVVRAIMDSFGKPFGVDNVPGGVNFWFELDTK